MTADREKLTAEIQEDILAAIPTSFASADLLERMRNFEIENELDLKDINMGALVLAATWLERFIEPGADIEVSHRTCALSFIRIAAMTIRVMKRKMGEEYSPGRFAAAAYWVARQVGEMPEPELPEKVA